MWTYLLQNVQYRKQVYYKPGKGLVYQLVCVLFSSENLPAVVMKGLTDYRSFKTMLLAFSLEFLILIVFLLTLLLSVGCLLIVGYGVNSLFSTTTTSARLLLTT